MRCFLFWSLFSLGGGPKIFFRPNSFFLSFYIHKWFQKNLFENFFIFGWNLIPILVKSEKSFHKSFLFKIEICPKIPFTFWRRLILCLDSYQKYFIFWPFGHNGSQIRIVLLSRIFFPLSSLIARTICWPLSPNFDLCRHIGSFLGPKWPNIDNFHKKLPILTKLTPLMTLLTKVMLINLTEIIFKNF